MEEQMIRYVVLLTPRSIEENDSVPSFGDSAFQVLIFYFGQVSGPIEEMIRHALSILPHFSLSGTRLLQKIYEETRHY